MDAEIQKLQEHTRKIAEENVGLRFLEVHDGFARAEMELKKEHFNFLGGVYGGILYHMADVTAGAAFMSAGGMGVTATGDMQYMNATHGIDKLFCEAKVLKYGSHMCFVQTELMDGEGTMFAKGAFSFYRLSASSGLPACCSGFAQMRQLSEGSGKE